MGGAYADGMRVDYALTSGSSCATRNDLRVAFFALRENTLESTHGTFSAHTSPSALVQGASLSYIKQTRATKQG